MFAVDYLCWALCWGGVLLQATRLSRNFPEEAPKLAALMSLCLIGLEFDAHASMVMMVLSFFLAGATLAQSVTLPPAEKEV